MNHYYLFMLTTLLIAITPGADTVLVTKNTLAQGKRVGLKTVVGICTGIIIHELLAILGLSAIIASSVLLFEFVKYAGAAFLIYMGISTLFSKKKNITAHITTSGKTSKSSSFLQGVFSNVLNPKAVIFFVSFLPQFIVRGENTLLQMFLLGVVPVFITLIWLVIYVYLIDYVRIWFNKPSFQSAFQRITGFMLITLGMKLVFEKR
ncbi:LysE family translocator [Aneurinibacillus tyrosinisolvens]|uniref:LysE family translocator n=1 Tax=Aneurinibacillus tyrosinisolvens TaxID=1443435 RepID=UPI00063F36DC|nr:LysE family translocator [Aneurinibacillus tyrosinisolvens]